MLAPFALAVAGNARATAAVGVVAVALALLNGHCNGYDGSNDHVLRVAAVTAGRGGWGGRRGG
mgnify:CR=1 FL=1